MVEYPGLCQNVTCSRDVQRSDQEGLVTINIEQGRRFFEKRKPGPGAFNERLQELKAVKQEAMVRLRRSGAALLQNLLNVNLTIPMLCRFMLLPYRKIVFKLPGIYNISLLMGWLTS